MIVQTTFDILFHDFGMIILCALENVKLKFTEAVELRDKKRMIEAIELHKSVIESFEKLKVLYSPIIFNKCLHIALVYCVCGFQIVMVRKCLKYYG